MPPVSGEGWLIMPKALELAGKIFYNVHVLASAGFSPRGESLWECECLRCGRHFVAKGYKLTAKQQKDCGCSYAERKADLSGKTFGALTVLRKSGVDRSGNALYVCRCALCGNEKTFPANTVKSKPKSCGCQHYHKELLMSMSKAGVKKTISDGINLYTATREKANAGKAIPLRWVRVLDRRPTPFIFAYFIIKGKRYYKGGFDSPESAYQWALKEHRRVLDREGIVDPRKVKDLQED